MLTAVLSIGFAISLCLVGGSGTQWHAIHHHHAYNHTNPESGQGHIQTIHFGSYKPSPQQIKFARDSIADEESREILKKLVDILRESSVIQPQQNTEEAYSNEFDNERIADAAYESTDEDRLRTSSKLPTAQHHNQVSRPVNSGLPRVPNWNVQKRIETTPHHHHQPYQMTNRNHMPYHHEEKKEIHPTQVHRPTNMHVHSDNVQRDHRMERMAMPLVNSVCKMFMNSPEYIALCRDPMIQAIIRNNPGIAEEQYNIDIVGHHIQPTNKDVVSDFKDNHPVDQSVRYVIAKICVGPLPAACQKIATHV